VVERRDEVNFHFFHITFFAIDFVWRRSEIDSELLYYFFCPKSVTKTCSSDSQVKRNTCVSGFPISHSRRGHIKTNVNSGKLGSHEICTNLFRKNFYDVVV
jgi:hypothetical protein